MAIVLIRVDERLVHGQVVIGWGSRLPSHSTVSRKRVKAFFCVGWLCCSLEEVVVLIIGTRCL